VRLATFDAQEAPMSIRDGLEPSHSPDASTPPPQPGGAAGDTPAARPTGPNEPADPAWPPTWGQAQGPADGPSWSRTSGWPEDDPTGQSTSALPPRGPGGTAPDWTQGAGQPGPGDQTRAQAAWDQGGGHPTTPTWGTRPADAGSPRDRRPSRLLASVLTAAVLVAGGYGLSEVLDRNSAAPAGAGVPTAAPIAAAPVQPGEEPAAAVAKALLPTVVEIRRGASGLGSGFVYDSNGYIMTAAHVIGSAGEVSVRLYDGTELRGEVLGTDEANDVGVIKVDRTGLKAAPLAVGQNLQVGQLAVAIGSPFGLEETVTAGIVSSADRLLPDGRQVIQTDAPINPGNSGGILANRQGRVIGVNSAIRPGDGSNGNIGIGFAVPIDLAAESAKALVQGRPIETGFLGVRMAQATGNQNGVLVQEVTPGSPAEKAGLQPGDLVVAIDGKAVATTNELGARIRSHKPGDKISLQVVRNGDETTISATLGQKPAG
jgi:putative serine protease PepD